MTRGLFTVSTYMIQEYPRLVINQQAVSVIPTVSLRHLHSDARTNHRAQCRTIRAGKVQGN